MGQRRRGARTRLPRHVPRGRVLAPGRQHPADPRGRPARRLRRRGRSCAASPPATRSRSTWCARSACTSTRSTTSPTSARRPPPASAPCSVSTSRRSTRPSARPCTPRPRRGSPARARSRPGRRTPPRSPARWPSRRSTARCAARPRPSPIYEGEDGVIAWLLDGPDASYEVPLPGRGEAKRGILDSYTKEHSAEYQAQAWIDLARKLHDEHPDGFDPQNIESIVLHTSHHTHYVIGSGANDPQKYDPTASRETLDHSIPYIFTVALQDGAWHHVDSYAPERAGRADTVALWHKVTTAEDDEWTRRYHSDDPNEKAFGGRVVIRFTDGTEIVDEIAVADAHPLGARPFAREDYVRKFRILAEPVLAAGRDRAVPRPRPAPARAHGRRGRRAHDRRGARRARRRAGTEGAVLMLYAQTPAAEKRRLFRERLASRRAAAVPRRLQPAAARAHRGEGLRGRLHLGRRARAPTSGCPTSASRPSPRWRGRGQQIARMTDLPAIIDADTGFGEPMNVARTIQTLEDAGLAGTHIEDQINPKRCGHLDGKAVVDERHGDQAHPRGGRRPPRPELPDHGAHRHPRDRGPRGRDRPREGAGGCRSRRDLPRGDALARGVRGDARGGRRADPGQHDRVRQERPVLGRPAARCRA